MRVPSPTLSIRLAAATRSNLDRATKLTRRSRSFLMHEALERHLNDIIHEQTPPAPPSRLTTLLSLAGTGVNKKAPRSLAEIDAHIRWLRSNG